MVGNRLLRDYLVVHAGLGSLGLVQFSAQSLLGVVECYICLPEQAGSDLGLLGAGPGHAVLLSSVSLAGVGGDHDHGRNIRDGHQQQGMEERYYNQ